MNQNQGRPAPIPSPLQTDISHPAFLVHPPPVPQSSAQAAPLLRLLFLDSLAPPFTQLSGSGASTPNNLAESAEILSSILLAPASCPARHDDEGLSTAPKGHNMPGPSHLTGG